MRWRLARRGLVLYGGGLLFDFMWAGTILPFYGVMFVDGRLLFTLRTRWLVVIGVAAALAGWLVRWWRVRTVPRRSLDRLADAARLAGRRAGLLFDVFVNGTHPLLPWLAFLCAGMVLGRLLTLDWWRPPQLGAGFALYAAANLIDAGTPQRAAADRAERRSVRSGHRLRGERARHRTAGVRGDLVDRRPVRADRRRSTRCAAPGSCRCRSTSATRLLFNLVRRLARPDPAGRRRHGARAHRRLLGESPSPRPVWYQTPLRSRPRRAALPTPHRLTARHHVRRSEDFAEGGAASGGRRSGSRAGTTRRAAPTNRASTLSGSIATRRLLLDRVVADRRRRRRAPLRPRPAIVEQIAVGCVASPRTGEAVGLQLERHGVLVGTLRVGLLGAAHLLVDAEHVLDVVPVLVGDDVLRRQVTGRAELVLERDRKSRSK